MVNVNIEDAGLDLLLVGTRYPPYRENPLFRELYLALSLEWACRQTEESTPKPFGLPSVKSLTDEELKEAAGFFYGVCVVIDPDRYERTFRFCFILLVNLLEEINARSPAQGETVH